MGRIEYSQNVLTSTTYVDKEWRKALSVPGIIRVYARTAFFFARLSSSELELHSEDEEVPEPANKPRLLSLFFLSFFFFLIFFFSCSATNDEAGRRLGGGWEGEVGVGIGVRGDGGWGGIIVSCMAAIVCVCVATDPRIPTMPGRTERAHVRFFTDHA